MMTSDQQEMATGTGAGAHAGDPVHFERYRMRTAAVFAAAFVALTAAVCVRPSMLGDRRVDDMIVTHPGTLAWHLAHWPSLIASGPVVALVGLAVAAVVALRGRRLIVAAAIVVAPAAAGLAESVLKPLVGRLRPASAVLTGESGDGYPSGHVTGFTALVVVLLVVGALTIRPHRLRTSWIVLAGASIAAVAWSRVALGAHYATDTIGGALLGSAIGLCCLPLLQRLFRRPA